MQIAAPDGLLTDAGSNFDSNTFKFAKRLACASVFSFEDAGARSLEDPTIPSEGPCSL